MKTVHFDDVEGIPVFGTLRSKPLRRTLGVTAFGINAYTPENAGDDVVEDHTEERLGHDEIYVVMREAALEHVNAAIAADAHHLGRAQEDEDLASIRNDPRSPR